MAQVSFLGSMLPRKLQRLIEEQPQEFVPVKVDVTDEKLSMLTTTVYASGNAVASVPATTTIYFDQLGRMEILFLVNYRVMVYYNDGSFKYRFVTPDESKAKHCMDVMFTLSARAKGVK